MVRRRPLFPAHLSDAAVVGVPGPWEHRFVGAHGARFHVAVLEPAPDPARTPGEHAPLVLLLHGGLQNWFAWRHVVPVLAAAGWRVVAADLRGHGASDATPRGYHQAGLADDVDALVRSLGHDRAAVVGHDLGGWVGWTLAHRHTDRVAGLALVATPPPSPGVLLGRGVTRRWPALLAAAQVPGLPERRLLHHDGVRRFLDAGRAGRTPEADVAYYVSCVRVPSVAHTVLEPARWLARASVRPDGARWWRAVRTRPPVPLLTVAGERDGLLGPPSRDADVVVPGVGHLLPEEAPAEVCDALLAWLPTVLPTGV
ncbi:alpha/beta fold hydrolase [Aquipuribacter nitratireducens]|uniref:Alpha/beta fold hydrolase n=1 Tax=Aquipuribacter nitratireducens TaxID=650104 RepID=A0ABW0GQY1_9MICO